MPRNPQEVHYIHGQHKSAVSRHAVRTAEDSAAFLLPYLDKLPPNFKYLDMGCGPGSITVDLALRYPQASFVGLDAGDVVLAQARALAAERGAANIRFVKGDFLELNADADGTGDKDDNDIDNDDNAIEWGAYDVVNCNQVLVHMQRPVDGLKVMRRAARPDGGLVAAREAFRAGFHFDPRVPGVERCLDLWFELMRRNGSDPETGLKLPRLAMQAGWTRDQITASCGSQNLNSDKEKGVFAESAIVGVEDPSSSSRKMALDLAIVSEEGLAEMARDWRAWLADEASWAALLSGEIVCRNKA